MRGCLPLVLFAALLAGCGSAHERAIDAHNARKLVVERAVPPTADHRVHLKFVRGNDVVLQLPSPNGKWLLSAGARQSVQLRDVRRRQLVDTLSVVQSPTALGWSPDSTTVVVGDMHGRVSVWDEFKHRTFDLTGVPSPVTALAFSPDDRLVASAHADRTVRVWEARTRKQVAQLRLPGVASALRFSADGREIAAADLSRAWTLTLPR